MARWKPLRAAGLATAALLLAGPVPQSAGATPQSAGAALERGDLAWESRGQGHEGGRARPAPIARAVEAYEAAIAADPDSLEPYWKCLMALWFVTDFAATDEAAAREATERAREVAERAFEVMASRLGPGDPEALSRLEPRAVGPAFPPDQRLDVARVHFWAAINWGTWARSHGLLASVRQGVASRLHRYASVAATIEPGYDGGGPLRLLSRLHAEMPRVPFYTAWVDREKALPYARRALAVSPDDPGNRYLLALTLLDVAPDREAEAVAILQEVAVLEPRDDMVVEDLAMRGSARDRLRDRGETWQAPRASASSHAARRR